MTSFPCRFDFSSSFSFSFALKRHASPSLGRCVLSRVGVFTNFLSFSWSSSSSSRVCSNAHRLCAKLFERHESNFPGMFKLIFDDSQYASILTDKVIFIAFFARFNCRVSMLSKSRKLAQMLSETMLIFLSKDLMPFNDLDMQTLFAILECDRWRTKRLSHGCGCIKRTTFWEFA